MKSTNAKNILLVTALAASLSACDSNENVTLPTDSTTPEKIFGLVESISTAEQSVTVNGYTLQAARAKISYQDNQFELAYLTVGTQVEVETSSGSATEIELDPTITGIVSEIQSDSLVVNGVTFSHANQTDVAIGDWVMISAQMQVDNSWEASSIIGSPVLDNAEVEGQLSSLDATNETFNIGSMVVSYSNAYIEGNETLANGQWVEVEGHYANDMFSATEVDIESDSEYDGVEIEGTITWVNTELTYFEIDNRTTVRVTTQTAFEDGVQDDLKTGVVVDVEMLNSENGLVATEIDFKDKHSDTVVQEFSIVGTATINNGIVTINGIDFVINASTQFDDGLTKVLLDNAWVEAEGIAVAATDSVAAHWLIKEIESEIQQATISLEGPVNDNRLWNYSASDNTLAQFNDMWVDVNAH